MQRLNNRAKELLAAFTVFALVLGAEYAASLLCARIGAGIFTLFIVEGAMLAVVLAAARILREPRGECFPVRPPRARSVVPSIAFAVGLALVASAAVYFLGALIPQFTNTTDAAMYRNYFKDANPVLVALAGAAVPAFCEELIFRGYLQSRLRAGFSHPLPALLISALFFSAAHFSLYKALPTFMIGFAYAFIAYKTESVAITVFLHMVHNAVTLVSMSARGSEEVLPGVASGAPSRTLILAAAVVAVIGVFFTLLGLKLFGTLRIKGWKLGVLAGTAAVCTMVLMTVTAMSAIDVVFNEQAVCLYPTGPEDGKYTASFTLAEDRACALELSVYGEFGVEADFYLVNEKGARTDLASGENAQYSDRLDLKAGRYELHCDVAPAAGNTRSEFKYVISSTVVSYDSGASGGS